MRNLADETFAQPLTPAVRVIYGHCARPGIWSRIVAWLLADV